MTFQLDTSGAVIPLAGQPIGGTESARFWSDLSPFVQGYIEALFAAHSISRYRSDIDKTFSHGAFDMLAPETLSRIIADCEALAQIGWVNGAEAWAMRQAGGSELFPALTVQIGDDGKVRFA